jgi:hypothetical protein
VVCVEGGPSRESLDNIRNFLYDELHPENPEQQGVDVEEVSLAFVLMA